MTSETFAHITSAECTEALAHVLRALSTHAAAQPGAGHLPVEVCPYAHVLARFIMQYASAKAVLAMLNDPRVQEGTP